MQATGGFEVEIVPQGEPQKADGSTLGRMSVRKTFHGDLDGVSSGEMLTAMTDVEGSAAYVALEQVTGSLQGRHGTFVLHHSGTMSRDGPRLTVTVVPDSGSGELTGIQGTLRIDVRNGVHTYVFDYSVPGTNSPVASSTG
jgi:hypothetical protein